MSTTKTSLQDQFLAALKEQKISVHLYLISGIKLQGVIESFDNYVILLRGSGAHAAGTQMVYKHAASTIAPTAEVKFNPATAGSLVD